MRSYILGAESPPRKAIGHTGDLGYLLHNRVLDLPEIESAVVVLTNSSSVDGDPSNMVAQVLTQALFDLQPPIDLVKVASKVVMKAKASWNRVVDARAAQ